MENTAQLARRFEELVFSGTWIANTNYRAQLVELDWRQATSRLGTLNSIASLSFHFKYYISGVLEVLEGGALTIKDKYSFDMPAVESPRDWSMLLEELWTKAAAFAQKTRTLREDQLDAVFVKEEYGSLRRNIEAMIEHGYYHLGQIVIIRKMLDSRDS